MTTTRAGLAFAIAGLGLAWAAAARAEPPDPGAESRYPRAVFARPLTYPAGIAALGLDLATFAASAADPLLVRPGVGYGVTDEIELGFAAYTFTTARARGSLDAGLGVALVRGALGGRLEVIARAQGGYDLAAAAAAPLAVGIHAQLNVTDRLALITPGGQLAIALAGDPRPVTASLPISIGFQATATVYVQLDTRLAQLAIANAETARIGVDATPLFVAAWVNAVPALDVYAGVGLDVTPAGAATIGDTVNLAIGARGYLGRR